MILLAVLTNFLAIICGICGQLPSNFQKCQMQKPNFNECLRTAVESGLKLLKKPIPELNMASLEPLTFNNVVFPNRHKKVLALHERVSHIDFYGFTEAKVSLVNINFDKTSIQAVFELNSLLEKANITFSGEVFSEPVNYLSYMEIKFTTNKFVFDSFFEEYEKSGLTYAKILNTQLQWNGTMKVTRNLGDKREVNHVSKLVNGNEAAILADAKSDYERLFAEAFEKYANLVFSKVPISELFEYSQN